MNLSIDQYLDSTYTPRNDSGKENKLDFNWDVINRNIKAVQSDAAKRMGFDIKTKYIKAYDVDSTIVSLNDGKDFYHIIDLSMFGYFDRFYQCFKYVTPNIAVFYYRWLRYDLCLAQNDYDRANKYMPEYLYINEYEADLDYKMLNSSDSVNASIQWDEYRLMYTFYCLHEYIHYLLRNPVRESTNALTEIIVDSYLSNGLNHAGDTLFDKMSSIFAMQFKRNWEGSEDFREEVTCDFQALLCLLELPGFTGGLVTTQDIFYAVENALYVQNIIYVAKHIDEPITLADDFALRRTIIAHFAFMLEDGEFAELLNAALSKFNRFYVKGDLKTPELSFDKQSNLWNMFCHIFTADKNGDYNFPKFV